MFIVYFIKNSCKILYLAVLVWLFSCAVFSVQHSIHNNIKKMKYINIALGLLFSLLLFNCQTQKEEEIDFRQMPFSELFPYFLEISDTIVEKQIAAMLEDSIALFHPQRDEDKYFSEYEYHMYNSEYVYENEQLFKVGYTLIRFEPNETECYGAPKERNVYEVEIRENKTIFIEDEQVKDEYLITSELSHFLLNPLNKDFLPQKKEIDVDSLGIQLQSKGCLKVYSQIIPDSHGNKVSLYDFKKGLKKILNAFESIRNSVSLKHWKIPYYDLSLAKQRIINDMVPVFMFIYFDEKPLPIPPPPPSPYYID